MSKELVDLKKMNKDELVKFVAELRKNYFSLKLNQATAHVKDYSQFKKLRKSIAQTLTYCNRVNKNIVDNKG